MTAPDAAVTVVGFAEVGEPDAQQRRGNPGGQDQAGPDEQRLVVAAVQGRRRIRR